MNAQEFYYRVAVQGNGCWEWRGARNAAGYGTVYWNGKSQISARVAWELDFGPIPEGLEVLHTCDNPPCVRTGHLYLGDDYDNAQDCICKGRDRKAFGELHGRAKLTKEQVLEIRRRALKGGETYASLSLEFHVSNVSIRNAVIGKTWSHLPREETRDG